MAVSMTMTAGVSSPARGFLTDRSTAKMVRTNTGEVSFSTIDELYSRPGLMLLEQKVPGRAQSDLPRKLVRPP
jgi:hypothetical protein